MKPYTIDDAEAELREAIDRDDLAAIQRLEKVIDALDVHPDPVSPHSAALWYSEAGLRVFPLGPGNKMPLFPKAHPPGDPCKGECGELGHGFHDATNDRDTVNDWWKANPQANIGLATGHLIDAVDIDGLKGHQSRFAKWDMFEALDVLAKVVTPRPGGIHLWVPATSRGSKTGLLPGIDYRSIGGYVVAPPSQIAAGGKDFPGFYTFLTPPNLPSAA